MTIQLRWALRVAAIALSPFLLLASGRGIFYALQAFSLWLGLDAKTSEVIGGYFGTVGGIAFAGGIIFLAFRTWRSATAPADGDKGDASK